jgi:hypothetical protein
MQSTPVVFFPWQKFCVAERKIRKSNNQNDIKGMATSIIKPRELQNAPWSISYPKAL